MCKLENLKSNLIGLYIPKFNTFIIDVFENFEMLFIECNSRFVFCAAGEYVASSSADIDFVRQEILEALKYRKNGIKIPIFRK